MHVYWFNKDIIVEDIKWKHPRDFCKCEYVYEFLNFQYSEQN